MRPLPHALLVAVVTLGACDQVFDFTADALCKPRSDPTFHDEDGDGFEDLCDNCPTVANLTQADQLELDRGGAADGVGDACDPHPTLSTDVLADLVTFAEPNVAQRWVRHGGDWHGDGEDMIYGDTVSGAFSQLEDVAVAPPAPPFTMVVQLHLDSVPEPAGSGAFEVMTAFTETGTDGVAVGCGLYHYAAGSFGVDGIRIQNDYNPMESNGRDLTTRPALVEYTLVFEFQPGAISACNLLSESTTVAEVTAPLTVPPTGTIGFIGNNISATIHSLAIYR